MTLTRGKIHNFALATGGYLPRIAYNLDKPFQRCSACGKQALTMCMGFGCNAAGVVGCRIIDSPREKLIAVLTNSFMPCNGRFPTVIADRRFGIRDAFEDSDAGRGGFQSPHGAGADDGLQNHMDASLFLLCVSVAIIAARRRNCNRGFPFESLREARIVRPWD